MEALILRLFLVMSICVGLLVFIQFQKRSRKMTLLTFASVFALCFSVWCYKDLERQYERHHLLFDVGQILICIDQLVAANNDKGLQQAFKSVKTEAWWFHPERQQISQLRQSLNDALNDKAEPNDGR